MRPPGGYEPATVAVPALEAVRPAVDEELRACLERERSQVAEAHPDAVSLVDELIRLVSAGGKRLRPAFCYWGYRAAGGDDGRPIVLAAASLELLHSFAVVHDDVMDRSELRRGVASAHVRFASEHDRLGLSGDAGRFGESMAILAGDLAAVLADRLLMASGFPLERLVAARGRYDSMRIEMAVGQFLDLAEGAEAQEATARRISQLKTGSYTVEGPLHVGAVLAGGSLEVMTALSRYGSPLGEAFQVRDDLLGLLDGEADLAQAKPTLLLAKARELLAPEELEAIAGLDPGRAADALRAAGALDAVATHVNGLVEQARDALAGAHLPSAAREALDELARLVAVGEDPREPEMISP
jgi:geranylgeranyl diphosphate synthase, type I